MIKFIFTFLMILGIASCGKQNKETPAATTVDEVLQAAPNLPADQTGNQASNNGEIKSANTTPTPVASDGGSTQTPTVVATNPVPANPGNGTGTGGSSGGNGNNSNGGSVIMPVIPPVEVANAGYSESEFKKDMTSFLTIKTDNENIIDKLAFLEKLTLNKNLNLPKYQDALLKCSGLVNLFLNKEFTSLRFLCLSKILEDNIPYTKDIYNITGLALNFNIPNNYFIRSIAYKYFDKYPELINDANLRLQLLDIYRMLQDKKLKNDFDKNVFNILPSKTAKELNSFLLENFLKTEIDNVKIFTLLVKLGFNDEVLKTLLANDKKEIYYDFICDLSKNLKNQIAASKDLKSFFAEKSKLQNQVEALFYKNNCNSENPYKIIGGKL